MNQDVLLSDLCEVGAMAAIDRYFARLLSELGAGPAAGLAAAVTSAMHRGGHACLPLTQCAGKPVVDILEWSPAADGDDVAHLTERVRHVHLPGLADLRAALSGSPVIACGAELEAKRPLVLDGDNLYLYRMFAAESRLAQRLRELAQHTATPSGNVANWMREVLNVNSQEAIAAATTAVQGRLCVITGGPGTGKTTLAASLIALLLDLGLADPHRIALAAPTGKAAARLQESVRMQFQDGALADRVPRLRGFAPVARTVHRLLNSPDPFLDALLVDECSMVDMPLMDRLLDTLGDNTRLILLGDAEQLASVEPGSVFSDLCATAEDQTSPLAPCIVRLEKSYRFGPTSGIGRLAAAIRRSDADSVFAVLKDNPDTNIEDLANEAAFDQLVSDTAEEWATHIRDSRPEDAFPARRVLCAHRRGPFGVARFNRRVERHLREAGIKSADDEFYLGRPIIVTRNDRPTGLSNGDTGVVICDRQNRRRVWVPGSHRAGCRRFTASCLALPPPRAREFLRAHGASRARIRIRGSSLRAR